MTFYIVLTLFIISILYLITLYNRLVALQNHIKNAFSQIDVQLKRRYDLIPNLIETAKGYLKHERETLEAVTQARNSAASQLAAIKKGNFSSIDISSFNSAETQLASALGKLNFVMEAYPELKANENMMRVHEELSTTENRIAFARQAYNDYVMQFNSYRQSFPQNQFASLFGFMQDAAPLEFEDAQQIKEAPKVSF